MFPRPSASHLWRSETGVILDLAVFNLAKCRNREVRKQSVHAAKPKALFVRGAATGRLSPKEPLVPAGEAQSIPERDRRP